MKRWMENKVARQKAYSKLVNGTAERFAPNSKVATRCVAYSLTTKPEPAVYDPAMVRRVEPSKPRAVKNRHVKEDKRTWDNGSLVARCYGWNDYQQAASVLIKA